MSRLVQWFSTPLRSQKSSISAVVTNRIAGVPCGTRRRKIGERWRYSIASTRPVGTSPNWFWKRAHAASCFGQCETQRGQTSWCISTTLARSIGSRYTIQAELSRARSRAGNEDWCATGYAIETDFEFVCTTRDAIVDVDVVVVGREVPRTVVPDHAQREVLRLLGCERLSTVERGDTLHVYRYPATDGCGKSSCGIGAENRDHRRQSRDPNVVYRLVDNAACHAPTCVVFHDKGRGWVTPLSLDASGDSSFMNLLWAFLHASATERTTPASRRPARKVG